MQQVRTEKATFGLPFFILLSPGRLYTWRATCSPVLLMWLTIQTDTNEFQA
jgi:hypothetical protein